MIKFQLVFRNTWTFWSHDWDYSVQGSKVSRGCRVRPLYLCRGSGLPSQTSVHDMILKDRMMRLLFWGVGESGVLLSLEYHCHYFPHHSHRFLIPFFSFFFTTSYITNTAILLLNNFKEQSLLVFSIRSLFFVLTNVYPFLPQPAKEKLSQNPKICRNLLGFTEHPTPTSTSRVWHPPSCPVVNYRVILIDLGKTWSTAQYHACLVTLSIYEEMLNFVSLSFYRLVTFL